MIALILALAGLLMVSVYRPLGLDPRWAASAPSIWHLLVVGWLTQLIFGVAFWLFPRRNAAHPRGSITLAWGSWILLNLGLVLRLIAEPVAILYHERTSLTVFSGVLQWLAALLFVINTWPRIKER